MNNITNNARSSDDSDASDLQSSPKRTLQTNESQHPTLGSFPVELKVAIFRFIPLNPRVSEWCAIVYNHFGTKKFQVTKDNMDVVTIDAFLRNTLLRFKEPLQANDWEQLLQAKHICLSRADERFIEDFLFALPDNNVHTVKLNFKRTSLDVLSTLGHKHPHTVSLIGNKILDYDTLAAFAGVHTIVLDRCKLLHSVNCLAGVHTISLRYCSNLDTIDQLATVHTIDLSNCRKITDNAIMALNGVSVINLTNCSKITNQGIVHIGPKIREINLTNLFRVTGRVCKALYNAEIVYLPGNSNFYNSHLKHLTSIKKIHLRGKHITADSAKFLPYATRVSLDRKRSSLIDEMREAFHSNGADNKFQYGSYLNLELPTNYNPPEFVYESGVETYEAQRLEYARYHQNVVAQMR
eukprot:CAMPEP_0168513252 /NCGR_PEP_ID=MMETSP0405-20121227/3326_1 /TAXON_ID=498012 /ORGANISM="Trichosphaerium sp, Strain Am-I-7 wt" /LENGTH=408 /DNA_ID=CAMNT_0008531997 /DNA_START=56 /DNA_END=1278 /DNA_ORIENTATION=-